MPDKVGTVSLVGAGPGDVGLLTLRGRDLLAAADVVLCDALANPRLLNHCKPDARIVPVGKRAGQHAMHQDDINRLLIVEATAGHRVVRLKGGDPFVFGRGGEECQALAVAGVPFEVVPGVTAGIAAMAYAGIPITHRDYNSSFTLITGHSGDCTSKAVAAGDPTAIDWSAVARLPCVAFYMGTKALPDICARLIEHGMPPATPAATVSRGTTAMQRTFVGTIADLPGRLAGSNVPTPALTIVGRVVELRATLNWFESRPLFGQTIVVTRSRQSKSNLAEQLEALGARVLEAPTIEFRESSDAVAIEGALAGNIPWDWVIFPSDTGVAFTKQRLFELGLDCRAFGSAKVAAMGSATAAAVREQLGLRVDLVPPQFVAEAMAGELERRGEVAGRRFLILRADIGRRTLRDRLLQGGAADVRDVPIYETHPAASLPVEVVDALAAGTVGWVTFTSSSTAANFTTILGPGYRQQLANVRLASIGPVTTATLESLGLRAAAQAETFNIDGLIKAIVDSST